jgi:hypothetical protein
MASPVKALPGPTRAGCGWRMQAATHDEKQALNSSGSIRLITVLSQSTQGPFLIRQIDGHIRTEARQCPGKAEIDPVKAGRNVTGATADAVAASQRRPCSASRGTKDPRVRSGRKAPFGVPLPHHRAHSSVPGAERFADIPQRSPGAIPDDGRTQRGMVAAIGFEHLLHDDLAPLVLEIHVDIGRLAPLFRNEPFEQQVVAFGIDGRDAEDVADSRVRGQLMLLNRAQRIRVVSASSHEWEQ